MKAQSLSLIGGVFAITVLFLSNQTFSQTMKAGSISFSGVIAGMSEDFDYVVMNGVKIFLTAHTKKFDEKGNVLEKGLKKGLYAEVEVVQTAEGLFATKITARLQK